MILSGRYIISAIHGSSIGNNLPANNSISGSWLNIVKCIANLQDMQVIPSNSLKICIGDGKMSKFWHDTWIGDIPFASRFNQLFLIDINQDSSVASRFDGNSWKWFWRRTPRRGIESTQLTELLSLLDSVTLTNVPDYRAWLVDSSQVFSVSSARRMIDKPSIVPSSRSTTWCKFVPIKINVFNWHLNSLRLPTKINLLLRDIKLENTVCSLCDQHDEDEVHLFIGCGTTVQIWDKIRLWTSLQIPHWIIIEDIWLWVDGIPITGMQRIILRVIITSALWNIWRLRNSYVFKDPKFKKVHVFDSIVVSDFNWLYSRFHKSSINWTVWLQNPMNAL
ncbi:uncharacterized protein [Rutidosis leptorrhynchoides]|uniref:uncharacterized protein n=1 Tax=Rutidosis leptorrhynchoides TaxID=125765 RepID=UPI003A992E47